MYRVRTMCRTAEAPRGTARALVSTHYYCVLHQQQETWHTLLREGARRTVTSPPSLPAALGRAPATPPRHRVRVRAGPYISIHPLASPHPPPNPRPTTPPAHRHRAPLVRDASAPSLAPSLLPRSPPCRHKRRDAATRRGEGNGHGRDCHRHRGEQSSRAAAAAAASLVGAAAAGLRRGRRLPLPGRVQLRRLQLGHGRAVVALRRRAAAQRQDLLRHARRPLLRRSPRHRLHRYVHARSRTSRLPPNHSADEPAAMDMVCAGILLFTFHLLSLMVMGLMAMIALRVGGPSIDTTKTAFTCRDQ